MTPPAGGERPDPKKWPVRHADSYGGVVFRPGEGELEIALIRTKSLRGKELWALPKGGREEGEDAEGAAVREVREETGLEAEIVSHLDNITYWFVWPPEQVRYRKTVHIYLMRATGGDTSDHDDEVEEVRWFPVSEALRRLKFKTDRTVLQRAAELAARQGS